MFALYTTYHWKNLNINISACNVEDMEPLKCSAAIEYT